jgi:copper chaperone CopZ
MERLIVTVEGMQCDHCKRAVFTSLSGIPGIASADVELGRVTIEHDGTVTEAAVRDAIGVAGYTVTGATTAPIASARRTLPLAEP